MFTKKLSIALIIVLVSLLIFTALFMLNRSGTSNTPNFVLEASETSPLPGETIILSVDLDNSFGNIISGIRLTSDKGYNEFDSMYPYEWTMPIAKNYSGIDTYRASILLGDEIITSNEVTVTVKPQLSTLKQIYFDPAHTIYLYPGNSEQLVIMGIFSDGIERPITNKELGTTYSENIISGLDITPGNSPVFTVSEDGRVTAEEPGEAEVVAKNNGVENVRRIKVVPRDQ